MTFILGVIVGALAMWARDWVRAKPASPLLQLPAADLRAMLASLREAHSTACAERVRCLRDNHMHLADAVAKRAAALVPEMAELHDALRIVESRETPDPRGPYR